MAIFDEHTHYCPTCGGNWSHFNDECPEHVDRPGIQEITDMECPEHDRHPFSEGGGAEVRLLG